MKQPYKLKNAMLMMALSAIYPMQSFAAAGVAQFSAGDVTLRRGAGADALVKGRDIESGDGIVTGPSGRAQLRFSDGGLVSLQPNSQFNISRYADKNDAKEDSFLVDLLRGGMRAVTGLIGKRNRENYKVTTTTATIGIRGSAFNLAYNPDGSLSVSTELDEIEVCTRAGCIGLKAGESALVVNAEDAPIRTSTRATLPTPEPRQEPHVVGNQQGLIPLVVGAPPPAPPPPPPPPLNPRVVAGVAFAGMGQVASTIKPAVTTVINPAYVFDSSRFDNRLYGNGSVHLDAAGKADVYVSSGNATGKPVTAGTVTTVSSTGTVPGGDFMYLGTWSGATWTEGANTLTAGPTAFAIGQPTATTALSSLAGQHADYKFAAGTPVYSTAGESGTVLESSKLTLDFLAAGNYITADINVRMPAATSRLAQLAAIAVTTTDYNLRGNTTASGATFGGTLSVSSDNCVLYGYSCGTGVFNGFFGGNNAQKAGVSFAADTGEHGYLNGAATFSRDPLSTTPQGVVVTSGLKAGFMDGTANFYRYYGYTGLGSNNSGLDEFTFNGDQLVKYKQSGTNPSVTLERTTVPGTFGGVGRLADADFIGWGNWVTATQTNTYAYGYGSSGSTMLDALHYVVGKPTAVMPLQGQASYTLLGGTAPTLTDSYGTTTGQLVGGSLTVNFATNSVGVSIDTRIGTSNINVSTNAYISGSTFRASNYNGRGCTDINGMFVGTMANRAGLVYGSDVIGGRLSGAAGFQRTWGSGLSTTSPYSSY